MFFTKQCLPLHSETMIQSSPTPTTDGSRLSSENIFVTPKVGKVNEKSKQCFQKLLKSSLTYCISEPSSVKLTLLEDRCYFERNISTTEAVELNLGWHLCSPQKESRLLAKGIEDEKQSAACQNHEKLMRMSCLIITMP